MTGDRLASFSKAGVVRQEGRRDGAWGAQTCISAGASGTTTAIVRGVLA